jgi:uncharacterized phiE125 gp8 family phage protein
MRVTLVTPPAVEPLTATEVKARLGYGSEVSDSLASSLITAARQQLDGWGGWLGRALITQTWKITLPGFYQGTKRHYWFENPALIAVNDCPITLPIPPLQSISSISYVDTAGVTQTLSSSAYRTLTDTFATIFPVYGTNWPATRCQQDAVTITFVAGYGDAGSAVPEPIRSAIALQVAHLRWISAQNPFLSADRVEGLGEQKYSVGGTATAALNAAVTALIANYRIPI